MKLASKVADQVIIVGTHLKPALLAGLEEEKFPKDKIHFAKNFTEAMQILSTISTPETVVLIENDLPDQYF